MATCLVCEEDWGKGPTCQACNGEYACYGGEEHWKLSIVLCRNGDVFSSSGVAADAGCLIESLQVLMPSKADDLRDKMEAGALARSEKAARERETERIEARDAHLKSILAVTQSLLDKRALELIDESNSDVEGVTAEPSNE